MNKAECLKLIKEKKEEIAKLEKRLESSSLAVELLKNDMLVAIKEDYPSECEVLSDRYILELGCDILQEYFLEYDFMKGVLSTYQKGLPMIVTNERKRIKESLFKYRLFTR